jgi:hypothetical protein
MNKTLKLVLDVIFFNLILGSILGGVTFIGAAAFICWTDEMFNLDIYVETVFLASVGISLTVWCIWSIFCGMRIFNQY